MLPKSQCRAYVGYDEGSKVVRYYNAAMQNVLTTRNFCFLQPVERTPPEEIAIEPAELKGGNVSPSEGGKGNDTRRDNPRKRKRPDTDTDPSNQP